MFLHVNVHVGEYFRSHAFFHENGVFIKPLENHQYKETTVLETSMKVSFY